MRQISIAAVSAATIMAFAAPLAQANSISEVEGARIKEREGRYLNRQDREKLRRYGGNADSYGRYYGDGYYGGGGYYGGPGVSIYVGPRYGGYYGPYGY